MKNIWKLFVGDVRRLTSNIVSIIIVIGLVVIPGLFSWFNVSASWDPFANTGNLKFAVANDDEGYKSDLIPVKISIGDQVVNTLRANDQMDWTFTTKKEAIDGTKSGKYYAAVVIPKDFSTRMMTFFTADGDHATLTYYNNEKKNALAPKITGQGADTVAAQINEMFSATLTSTALNIASQLADELDKPKSQATLTNFSNNMNNFANTLNDTSSALTTFSSLTLSAQNLLDSSNSLLSNVSGSAKNAVNELKQSKNGINDLTGAVKTSTNALSTALSSSSNSFGAVSTDIDSVFNNAGTQAGNTATALRNQAANVSKQAQGYQNIYDALDELSNNNLVPEVAKIAINHLKTNVGANHYATQRSSELTQHQRRQYRRESERHHSRPRAREPACPAGEGLHRRIKTDFRQPAQAAAQRHFRFDQQHGHRTEQHGHRSEGRVGRSQQHHEVGRQAADQYSHGVGFHRRKPH